MCLPSHQRSSYYPFHDSSKTNEASHLFLLPNVSSSECLTLCVPHCMCVSLSVCVTAVCVHHSMCVSLYVCLNSTVATSAILSSDLTPRTSMHHLFVFHTPLCPLPLKTHLSLLSPLFLCPSTLTGAQYGVYRNWQDSVGSAARGHLRVGQAVSHIKCSSFRLH